MNLKDIKDNIKTEFKQVSDALFGGTISFTEVEESKRVFAEASSMFGANVVKYSESNYEYFYLLHKFLCYNFDLLNLQVIQHDYNRLKFADDLLSIEFIKQTSAYQDKKITNDLVFYEYNFTSNLFVYLHECGHLNQEQKNPEENIAANHFSEFNADYYAFTHVLIYYHTLRTKFPDHYHRKVQAFGNEHNLIRMVIVISISVVFFETLPKFNASDSKTHPAIRKRFCYLLVQAIQQLNQNFSDLFVYERLNDFIVDIFQTMHFIENIVFEKHSFVFDHLLNFCFTDLNDVKKHLESSEEFKTFNA